MYNGKPIISTALSTDGSLIALIPKVRMFDGIANFKGEAIFPYLTYEELTNNIGLTADDDEVESEVTFRIHLWGTSSLSTLAGHINRIMTAIGYTRNFSMDNNELNDDGQAIKHKILSFSGTFTNN